MGRSSNNEGENAYLDADCHCKAQSRGSRGTGSSLALLVLRAADRAGSRTHCGLLSKVWSRVAGTVGTESVIQTVEGMGIVVALVLFGVLSWSCNSGSGTNGMMPHCECGDGVVCGSERCDDGNTNNCDACHNDCMNNTGCGDGQVCPPEECEPPGTGSCDANCKRKLELEGTYCASCGYQGPWAFFEIHAVGGVLESEVLATYMHCGFADCGVPPNPPNPAQLMADWSFSLLWIHDNVLCKIAGQSDTHGAYSVTLDLGGCFHCLTTAPMSKTCP